VHVPLYLWERPSYMKGKGGFQSLRQIGFVCLTACRWRYLGLRSV